MLGVLASFLLGAAIGRPVLRFVADAIRHGAHTSLRRLW
jgi:hypothetical protein